LANLHVVIGIPVTASILISLLYETPKMSSFLIPLNLKQVEKQLFNVGCNTHGMEAMLGVFLIAVFISSQQKCNVFIISYVFSSTKLEKRRVEQVLPGSEAGRGGRVGAGAVGKGGPNNVYAYE
jgi:hypothetical protein